MYENSADYDWFYVGVSLLENTRYTPCTMDSPLLFVEYLIKVIFVPLISQQISISPHSLKWDTVHVSNLTEFTLLASILQLILTSDSGYTCTQSDK